MTMTADHWRGDQGEGEIEAEAGIVGSKHDDR
jgi:hypothetical protein